AQEVVQKGPSLAFELCQYPPRRQQRLEFVAVIEWRAGLQITVQLQIRQQRTRDQRADVVSAGQVAKADIEAFARREQFLQQRMHRTLRGRVAVSKVFQHAKVVAGGQHFAGGGGAVAAGATDFL